MKKMKIRKLEVESFVVVVERVDRVLAGNEDMVNNPDLPLDLGICDTVIVGNGSDSRFE